MYAVVVWVERSDTRRIMVRTNAVGRGGFRSRLALPIVEATSNQTARRSTAARATAGAMNVIYS